MIQTVLSTLIEVVVPLSVPIIAGALIERFQRLDTKPLLTLYLYFLSPAIILDTLAHAKISFGDIYLTAAFTLLNLLFLWGTASGISRIMKFSAPDQAGLTLVSVLTNSANYGIPLVLLAFGQAGLDKASVYIIGQMLIINTLGVYFAARSHFSVKNAVKSVLSLPAIYAAVLALLLRGFNWHLPAELDKGISMAAGAYSPVVLAILGAQMMKVVRMPSLTGERSVFWTGMAVRMLLAPLLALGVLTLLGITGTLRFVLLILASMPVAVNSVILAERFSASPTFVSRCILWTTLGSFLVLPVLIALVSGE
ncbi:putative permease [Paenibacillus forsythiae]|uniref:Permease n=1 Tax=Paenibacillus forsythiae TaxID=365616 RepID=A0ABU3H4K8_9BACL|nr:AEC family transporter [Paenibacillus forsythiae]MDT3425386.1 putative permease [Paenibacillus forsythiae]